MRFFVLISLFFYGYLGAQTTEMELNIESMLIDAEVDLALGDEEQAIKHCKDVLEEDASNDVAAFLLAKIYDQADDYDSALSFINSAISSNQNNRWYYELLVDILKKQGFNKQAADVYDELLRIKPHDKEYLLQKAYFLEKAKYDKEALAVLDEYQKWYPLSQNFVGLKINLLTKMKKYDTAADLAEQYLEIHPDNQFMMSIYGSLLYEQGKEAEAKAVYEELQKLDPYNTDAQKFIKATSVNTPTSGDNYYVIASDPGVDFDKKFPLFKPLLDKMEVGNKEVLPVLDSLGRVLLTTHPTSAKAAAFYADVLLFGDKEEEAQTYYAKTLELDPSNQQVWENYLWYYFEKEDFATLQQATQEALTYFPNNFSFLFLNGVAEFQMGDKESAMDSFDTLFTIAPDENEYVKRARSFLFMHGQ